MVLDNQATEIDIVRAYNAGCTASIAVFNLPSTARHVLPRGGLGRVEDGVAGAFGTLQLRRGHVGAENPVKRSATKKHLGNNKNPTRDRTSRCRSQESYSEPECRCRRRRGTRSLAVHPWPVQTRISEHPGVQGLERIVHYGNVAGLTGGRILLLQDMAGDMRFAADLSAKLLKDRCVPALLDLGDHDIGPFHGWADVPCRRRQFGKNGKSTASTTAETYISAEHGRMP